MATIDRRKIRSQKAIHAAFLELLIEVGFDNIMIKEIAERADIGRKTFYLHYVDKYDLLDHIVDTHIEELKEICEYKKTVNVADGSIIWFKYFEKNKSFFAELFKSTSTYSFRKKLLDFIMDDLGEKLSTPQTAEQQLQNTILLKFLGMAVVGVVESYVLEELSENTEDVAVQVGELVMNNI